MFAFNFLLLHCAFQGAVDKAECHIFLALSEPFAAVKVDQGDLL